jgi:hypothetical protein
MFCKKIKHVFIDKMAGLEDVNLERLVIKHARRIQTRARSILREEFPGFEWLEELPVEKETFYAEAYCRSGIVKFDLDDATLTSGSLCPFGVDADFHWFIRHTKEHLLSKMDEYSQCRFGHFEVSLDEPGTFYRHGVLRMYK